MKTKITKALALLVVILPVICQATTVTFTSSGTIINGDVFDDVYVENDGTVVDMTGGQVGYLWLEDESRFNMSGGNIAGGIDAHGTSYFEISGGTIDIEAGLILYGDGGCFSGGNITAFRLKTGSFSTTQIDGGVLSFNTFDIYGTAIINDGTLNISGIFYTSFESLIEIYGGSLTVHDLWFALYSTMNIYSENYNYNVIDKVLTGYLIDGSYFSIGGVDQGEYDRINFVPEPTTMLLFGLGGLFLRRQNQNNSSVKFPFKEKQMISRKSLLIPKFQAFS